MPQVHVPLTRPSQENASHRVKISYRVVGRGPVLVLLVPGLCVPSTMYDSMAAVLSATSQFTSVLLDNRGIGESDTPPARVFGGAGYSVRELAADAWSVVDDVVSRRDDGASSAEEGCERVALVGHSMGGMIVQEMTRMRPREVGFMGLLATHAGGMWNLVPTIDLIRSMVRVAWSGFDRDVHAAVNLSLHFTQRFLDGWVVPEMDLIMGRGRRRREGKGKAKGGWGGRSDEEGESEGEDGDEKEGNMGDMDDVSVEDDRDVNRDESDPVSSSDTARECASSTEEEKSCSDEEKTNQSEEKHKDSDAMLEATPQSDLVEERHEDEDDLGAKSPIRDHAEETHRGKDSLLGKAPLKGIGFFESKVVELARDLQVYFHFPKSIQTSLLKPQRALFDAIAKRRRARRRRRDIYHARYTGSDQVETQVASSEGESAHTMYGHAAVVRSHALSRELGRKLRACTRIVKLVMLGRHDQVITPSSSRALANLIGANTVVEVEAAHFITDEAAAEVTTHVIYGLRKAFFAGGSGCACEWCEGEEVDDGGCRMC